MIAKALPAFLLLFWPAIAAAQALPSDSRAGSSLFRRYCAACHGVDAHGDGPVSVWLVSRPPDLTAIAARNGGVFDADAVARHIDGREEVAAHGLREMPVWGDRFLHQNKAGMRDVRIEILVAYLKSLQDAQ